jgi:hypothetical protein
VSGKRAPNPDSVLVRHRPIDAAKRRDHVLF